jgi:hypothetical protein
MLQYLTLFHYASGFSSHCVKNQNSYGDDGSLMMAVMKAMKETGAAQSLVLLLAVPSSQQEYRCSSLHASHQITCSITFRPFHSRRIDGWRVRPRVSFSMIAIPLQPPTQPHVMFNDIT